VGGHEVIWVFLNCAVYALGSWPQKVSCLVSRKRFGRKRYMSQDSIGDFLTIIRNGIMASKMNVLVPFSGFKLEIASILKGEGFIKDALVEELDGKKMIKVLLKYVDGESVIHELKRVSTPGRRQYRRFFELKPVIGGLGISILTTSKGLMTDKRAKNLTVGGEVLCTVW